MLIATLDVGLVMLDDVAIGGPILNPVELLAGGDPKRE